jgi:acyl-CoA reductase-like NAD-dependent aldehyde dehydrogenase
MSIARELLIDGKSTPAAGGRTTADTSPSGELYATVAAASAQDVTAAVDAAHAQLDAWSATPPFARRAIFLAAADLVERRADEVVALMAAETGSLAGNAMFNIGLAANILREAGAAVTAPRGEVLAAATPGAVSLAVREPLGVVAAFAPWNAPVILGIRAVAGPLAAGNTVVLKASEEAPVSSGLFIADLLAEAGLPDGVLNVITNDPVDAAVIAQTLIGDERVRAVNFTGSTAVGRIIGTLAAQHLKPAVLELGGKNAVIVLEDADIDYAVNAAAYSVLANAGQICMSGDRVLVHESRAAEFTEKFAAKVGRLPAGLPDNPGAAVGPLVNITAAQRVAGLVSDAIARGATVVAGGGDPDGPLHPPTVLSGVPADADLYYAEAFGPICVIDTFASDDEAVAKAGDTDNGLTAGIITEDATHGLAVARRLKTGIVHINDQTVDDEPQAPFGGFGASGYGRFGGRWALESFSNTRWVTMATDHTRYPF